MSISVASSIVFSKMFTEQHPAHGQSRFFLVLHQDIIALHQIEMNDFLEGSVV